MSSVPISHAMKPQLGYSLIVLTSQYLDTQIGSLTYLLLCFLMLCLNQRKWARKKVERKKIKKEKKLKKVIFFLLFVLEKKLKKYLSETFFSFDWKHEK